MVTPKMTVWILHIHHRHGDDYWANGTESGARDALMAYVEQWWDEDGPGLDDEIPADRDEATASYFEGARDEWYGLQETEVGP